ncbi:MAG: hypothetical protein ACUVQG_12770, partial [Thermogutta sp.]
AGGSALAARRWRRKGWGLNGGTVMNSSDSAPSRPQYWQPLSTAEEEGDDPLTQAIWEIVSRIYPAAPRSERREASRYAFPYLIQFQPVLEDGVSRIGSRLVVVGKQISEGGLGFYHPRPLPCRFGIALLDVSGKSILVLIELLWTQFTHHGWYESGGKFVRLVSENAALRESA